MSAIGSDQIRNAIPIPGFLVELPSRHRVFFGNLRDLVLPRRLPQLDVESAPAAFWPDVFVKRGLPWAGFLESGFCHLAGFILLVAVMRFVALHPQPMPQPVLDRPQVIYYSAAEYLPPLDTRVERPARSAKADPEIARQPIISVPPEADNRSQTIIAPPNVRLTRDLALPNIVAWSQKMEQPQLEIPAAPTLAAEITRLAPRMKDSVVNPPPDAARLTDARKQLSLQASVVAPPPDLRTSRTAAPFEAPQPSVVAPPPFVENAPTRTIGELNIGHSSVIGPAPQLAVGEQRAVPGGRSLSNLRTAPQVVPPPPTYSAGSVGSGSADRVIALNLHPAMGAPPDPPRANRRGSFAATPEGHPGASGTPGSSAEAVAGLSTLGSKGGSSPNRKAVDGLPSGLYVGSAPAPPKNSSAAADPGATTTLAREAGVSSPRVGSVPARPMQPEATAKISEAERAVFGTRRLYSLTLNMPNLNSNAGSWVVRFAELKQDPGAPAGGLSQPAATRQVDPGYPLQLMRENVSGTVIVYAVIRADGTVDNVRVLRGVDERLDKFASEAVTQWRFQPAMKNGSPVDVEATFLIPFHPPRVGTNF
jgi:TonB family protein